MADKNYALTFEFSDGSKESVQFTVPQGPAGADGKSAYEYAQAGGYTGTEEEFAAKLAEDNNTITIEQRWTNSYVNSEFAAQDIDAGLEDSDMYMITYVTGTSILAQKVVVAPVGKSARMDGVGAGTNRLEYVRTATYSSGVLSFGSGYKNGAVDNTVMIPARIYAIKGVVVV